VVELSVFDLIAKLLEAAFAWLPRPVLVPRIESMVRWTLSRPPTLQAGLVWIIPLIHHYEIVDLRSYCYEFEPKVLWTRDGKEVAVGMAVLWRVDDPVKFGSSLDDPVQIVNRLGESVLPELVGGFTLDELKRKAAGGSGREWAFDTHLRKALGTAFEPYGIVVEMARLNFTSDKVRTLKLIGSQASST
jgi:regulator of protease activity HflC (stomatin/prohibitin superfamily)